MMPQRKYRIYQTGAVLLMILALYWSFYQWRGQRMGTNWMAPFMSAAQNLRPGERVFLIDLSDIRKFKALDDVVSEDGYRFQKSSNLQPYIYDPIGYPYLIKAATLIFPWAGHQLAIILFQCLVHLILCWCVLSEQKLSRNFRILFLILYALNPIVLRFVTFNHYYFWQAIPSFWLLFLALDIRQKIGWLLLMGTLPFVLLARPTTIFIAIACLVALYRHWSGKWAIAYTLLVMLLVGWLYVPNQKNPWHTMYVGIGGYENPYGIVLSDESAYSLYERETKVPLSASVGNNYFDPVVQRQYRSITKEAYLSVLRKNTLLLAKNAAAYFFGAFSLGYVNKGADWLNYLVSASGLVFFLWLLLRKKYQLLLWMVLSVAGFVFYYPPIQSYMYGNYLLLVWGFIALVEPSLSTFLAKKSRDPS
ncbi:hypothetical protein [Persicitalea jodogahamensis]|uniref:Uncharacterized protein n=1 Tax=Persicitalea jodogahamensis TaxID=402147 RepID=A0A8J3DAQ3_9BACT|nr:hypothetical protein [Persicitalea jodogahamensis]GHB83303.1 hypothetical protein GCM10007390_42870 [Persicitalea jodogahamensis]